jgi:CheY-like chemotaxis protein
LATQSSGMTQTILIAANDPNIAYLLQRYAEESGFQAAHVRQSEDVPALASQLQPTVIILDVELVGMPDREVLKRLEADPSTREIPVIIYSCLDEPPDDWRASVDGLLLKSIMYSDFVAVLKRAGAGEYLKNAPSDGTSSPVPE